MIVNQYFQIEKRDGGVASESFLRDPDYGRLQQGAKQNGRSFTDEEKLFMEKRRKMRREQKDGNIQLQWGSEYRTSPVIQVDSSRYYFRTIFSEERFNTEYH